MIGMSRNSATTVFTWVQVTLRDSPDLSNEERKELTRVATPVVFEGGLRGDVCDVWRKLGYDGRKIKDWYP